MIVRELLTIVNALADGNRLRLLMSLSDREVCVCDLVEFIGLADSTVSKHMTILRDAGLVQSRRRGRWVYYRWADGHASAVVQEVLALVRKHLATDELIAMDAARMSELLTRNGVAACGADAVPRLATTAFDHRNDND